MSIGPLREAGSHAVETHTELKEVERHGNFSKFETSACAVVYADRCSPSHSIRIFKFKEEK